MSLSNWSGYEVTQTTISFSTLTDMYSYLRRVRVDKGLVLPSVIVVDDSTYIFDNNRNRYVKQLSEGGKVFVVNSLPTERPEVQQFQTGNDIQAVEDYIDSASGDKIRLVIKTLALWSEEDILSYVSDNFIGIIIENAGSISGTYYSYDDGDRGYGWIPEEPGRYNYYETIEGLNAEEFSANFTEESNLIFLTREPGVYVIAHNLNTLQPIVKTFDSGSRDNENLMYYSPSTSTPGFMVRDSNTITIPENYISSSTTNSRYIKITINK